MSKPKAKKKGYIVLYALAFLLAASIAVRRAPSSLATDSDMAP